MPFYLEETYLSIWSEPHVVPFARYIGLSFHLMYDNSRPRIANIVQTMYNNVLGGNIGGVFAFMEN